MPSVVQVRIDSRQVLPAQQAWPEAPQGDGVQVWPAPVQPTPVAQVWLQQMALSGLQMPLAHSPSAVQLVPSGRSATQADAAQW
jgi:hypothetical protein